MMKYKRCGECKNFTAHFMTTVCCDCEFMSNFEKKPPMTNGDRIRAMTDEELADCIADLVVKKIGWDLSETGHELGAAQISEIKRIWACSLREWLKQPAEVEE